MQDSGAHTRASKNAMRVSDGELVHMATSHEGSACHPCIPSVSPWCPQSLGAPPHMAQLGHNMGVGRGGWDAVKCHMIKKNIYSGISVRCKALNSHSAPRPCSPCGILTEVPAMLTKANRRDLRMLKRK